MSAEPCRFELTPRADVLPASAPQTLWPTRCAYGLKLHRTDPRFARQSPGSKLRSSLGSCLLRKYRTAPRVASGVFPLDVINPRLVARLRISFVLIGPCARLSTSWAASQKVTKGSVRLSNRGCCRRGGGFKEISRPGLHGRSEAVGRTNSFTVINWLCRRSRGRKSGPLVVGLAYLGLIRGPLSSDISITYTLYILSV
jgi:hypothetical protein